MESPREKRRLTTIFAADVESYSRLLLDGSLQWYDHSLWASIWGMSD